MLINVATPIPDWKTMPIQMRHDGTFIIKKNGLDYCVNPISRHEYTEVYEYAVSHTDQVEILPDSTPSSEEQLAQAKESQTLMLKGAMTTVDVKLARTSSELLLAMVEPSTVSEESTQIEETKQVFKYLMNAQRANREALQSVASCTTIEEVQALKPVQIDIATHLAGLKTVSAKYEVK